MSDEWSVLERATLKKLIEKAEKGDDFTAEELEVLALMARAWIGLRVLRVLMKWVVFILAALAGAITSWETVSAGVRSWLSG